MAFNRRVRRAWRFNRLARWRWLFANRRVREDDRLRPRPELPLPNGEKPDTAAEFWRAYQANITAPRCAGHGWRRYLAAEKEQAK